jgi:hypothetical protein
MNANQEHWWRQAKSDHEILDLLRSQGVDHCHELHYLQMVTEKLAKAYFWRTSSAPPRNHTGFVQFMRRLGAASRSEQESIASVFAFTRFEDFQQWIRTTLPLAYALEKLAPALAQNGPNPEYPWPHNAPIDSPASHDFDVWRQLTETGSGRQLLKVIKQAVDRFDVYA